MGKSNERIRTNYFLYSLSIVLLVIILAIFLMPVFCPSKFSFTSTEYSTFVGGLAGPLAALVGFIYVYLTFIGQQKQINDQRERLNKEETQKQREEAAKQFSEYLTLWIEIRSKVTYTSGDKGEAAFEKWWGKVSSTVRIEVNSIGEDLNNPIPLTNSLKKHLYSKGFNGKNDQYDNFLRVIYLLLEIAEKNGFQDRVKILESFMTRSEKAILIYSATFIDENSSAIKLFKSGFCKSIPEECLISPEHRNLIF